MTRDHWKVVSRRTYSDCQRSLAAALRIVFRKQGYKQGDRLRWCFRRWWLLWRWRGNCHRIFFFFFFFSLHWAFVAACGLSLACNLYISMVSLVEHRPQGVWASVVAVHRPSCPAGGSCPPTTACFGAHVPWIARQALNHWTTRETCGGSYFEVTLAVLLLHLGTVLGTFPYSSLVILTATQSASPK